MRYQEYKAKMMKIRKVMDFFYRFRFVFIGAAVAIAATITTLDVTKGNITSVSDFEVSYVYGDDDIKYEGSAFMGDVTFQFRKANTADDWSEEKPYLVGIYEARARSQGSHGYKYSEVSTFEIKPRPISFKLATTNINYGDNKPSLSYDKEELGKGDSLENYTVEYADLASESTTANIENITIVNEKGRDVTSCYTIDKQEENISFIKKPITITFRQDEAHYYDGNAVRSDVWDLTSGELLPGHHIETGGGISVGSNISDIKKHNNTHTYQIIGEDGRDYTCNYDVTMQDNYIEIIRANPLVIKSKTWTKTYDGEPFPDDYFDKDTSLELTSGQLLPGHRIIATSYANKDIVGATLDAGGNLEAVSNDFTYDIVDSNDNPINTDVYENITPIPGTLTITQREITISSRDASFDFNNKNHSETTFVDGLDYRSEELADGDYIYINEEACAKAKDPTDPTTPVSNKLDYVIRHGGPTGPDVTANYTVKELWGELNVTVKPLQFIFTPTVATYDGEYHPLYTAPGYYADGEERENAAILDESYQTLPDGWTYDVRIPNTVAYRMKEVKTNGYNIDLPEPSVTIRDEFGEDVSYAYQGDGLLSFVYNGVPNMMKKRLDITVKDFSKVYDTTSVAADIVINPNDPSTCVEYDGLISGDSPIVVFAGSAASEAIEASDTPYTLSLTYGVNSSTGSNVTGCYDIHFTNDKETIDATIERRNLVVRPGNSYKTYDGNNVFTPDSFIYDNSYGEVVSIKPNITTPYVTTSSDVGDYSYSLNPNDIMISINDVDVTKNYNIFTENSATFSIFARTLHVRSTVTSSDHHVYYDEKPHGVFSNPDGTLAKEVSTGGQGLVAGHQIRFNNPQTVTDPDTSLVLYGNTNSTFDTVIVDTNDGNRDVTSNYYITYDDFEINIVQNTIDIQPRYLARNYDGSIFEMSGLESIPYWDESDADEAYVEYDDPRMQTLFYVSFDSFGDGTALKPGHRLMLTKYTRASAEAAIATGTYQFKYKYKIVDSDNNDVTSQYKINAPQTWYYLQVSQAEIAVYCNSGGKQYDGQVLTPPSFTDFTDVSTDIDDIVYIFNNNSAYGSRFFNNFRVMAKFENNNAYTLSELFYAGSYSFNVIVKLTDIYGNEISNSSINLIVNKNYYDYTISKSVLQLQIKQTRSGGRELRDYSGTLAAGDELCFGTLANHEAIDRKKAIVYSHLLSEYIIIRNGTTDVTSCYTVNLS